MVEKFKVSGQLAGIDVEEFFEHKHEAEDRVQLLKRHQMDDDFNNEAFTVTPVQVPEEL